MRDLKNKLRNIRIFLTDVDGVLTDGKIVLDPSGREIKIFHVLDGAAVRYAAALGYKTIMISGRCSDVVKQRGDEVGVHQIYQKVDDKLKVLKEIIKKQNLLEKEICYLGDELPDIPVLKNVGLSVAVRNAVPEVKACADYVTKKPGGEGAFREIVEMVLKAQGRWREVLDKFL